MSPSNTPHSGQRVDIFGDEVARYDAQRAKVIPGFRTFYGTVVDLIHYATTDRFRVLDLGAGTGLLSALIIKSFMLAEITLVDISEKMLSKARERFRENKRVRFLVSDYTVSLPEESYQFVVSAMSIHHLENPEKKGLFCRILDRLSPGGMFINADIVKGETPFSDNLFRAWWLKQINSTDLSEEERKIIFKRIEYDRPARLEEQLAWLREAGYRDADCFYKLYNFVVYGARK